MPPRIETFTYDGEQLAAQFQESIQVVPGVTCDVYIHPETEKRDLAIITIEPGSRTPVQRVLNGELTIEGYLSGKGKLIVLHTNGTKSVFEVDSSTEAFSCPIMVGEILQWQADPEEELHVFEICCPPYEDGRYENLEQEDL